MATIKKLLPRAWLEVEVKDGNGRTLHRSRRRAHSWAELNDLAVLPRIKCVSMPGARLAGNARDRSIDANRALTMFGQKRRTSDTGFP